MIKKKDRMRYFWAPAIWAARWRLLSNILTLGAIFYIAYTWGESYQFTITERPTPAEQPCDCPPPPPVDMTELQECVQARGRWKERYQDLAVAVDNDILQCDIREALSIKNNR